MLAHRHAVLEADWHPGHAAPIGLIQDLLGHANLNTTKTVYAAYEQRGSIRGLEKFNPSASQQIAELEVEQARPRVGPPVGSPSVERN